MKFLGRLLALLMVLDIQAAQHPAHTLAQAFIALIGERYGKASSMSVDFETALDDLYADTYMIISNDNLIATSRNAFKENLKKAKCNAGLWRVTDVIYAPNGSDTKVCKIAFRCWTEKTGVFDVNAEIQSSFDGARIEFLEETVEQIYTVEQVS